MFKKIFTLPAILGAFILLVWLSFPFSGRLMYSDAERRQLEHFPTITTKALVNASYGAQLERAFKDHFPARELWRNLDMISSQTLFGRLQHQDYAISQGHLIKLSYGINVTSVDNAAHHMRNIYDTYLMGTDCHCYLCVIPEKTQFLGYPHADASIITAKLQEALPYLTQIPINDTLALSSYYRTDPHWKQETLQPVAERILSVIYSNHSTMDLSENSATDHATSYTEKIADTSFYGAYRGGAGFALYKDILIYLSSPSWENIRVTDPITNTGYSLYDHLALAGRDPYAFFLSGNQPILRITNYSHQGDAELVIFRDSFAAPLVPLLISSYHKITLIDTRYISPTELSTYVTFQEQDVLFLYSTLLLNDSATLRD